MAAIRKWFFTQPLAVYLVFACFIIASVPKESLAYMASSQTAAFNRNTDISTVQRVLESKAVSQRLSELGLTIDEINKRINNLTDSELHQFASQLDSIHAGGDGLGVVIGVLLVVVLVLVILNLTGHKIIVK